MLRKYSLFMLFAFATILTACKEDTTVPKSSAKAITKFTFSQFNPSIQANIDENTKRITAVVPPTADITKLIPSISVSLKAKVLPDSGKVQDFTNEVTYSVTAEDGTKVDYKVMVSRTKFSGKDITEFSFADFSPSIVAKIDPTTKTITATVPATADLTKLKPTLKLSDRATVNPVSGTVVDFSKAVNFTVMAEDAGTQAYAVTVVKEVVVPVVTSDFNLPANNTVKNMAILMTQSNTVVAANSQTGKTVWEWVGEGGATTGTAVDDVLYLSDLFAVYAIDLKTGNEKWRFGTGGDYIFSSPVVYKNIVYFGCRNNKLYAVDAKTGTKKWEFTAKGEINASPSIYDDKVIVGSKDKNIYALDLLTGVKKWEFATNAEIRSNAAISNGTVYFGSDKIYALDGNTGTKKWEFVTPGSLEKSPTVINGNLYIAFQASKNNSLNLYAYSIDSKTGKENWSYSISGSGSDNNAIIAGNFMYFTLYDRDFYSLDIRTGKENLDFPFRLDFGDYFTSNPCIADGIFYIGTVNGKFYAYDIVKKVIQNKIQIGGNFARTPIVIDSNGKTQHSVSSGMMN